MLASISGVEKDAALIKIMGYPPARAGRRIKRDKRNLFEGDGWMFKKAFDGLNGAEMLVQCLEAAGVRHVFGIPGAKIDPVFEAIKDSSIELVVCRHEQNAGFIAACMGRLTGIPGVCIGTSGPGTSNFVTPLITATTEGDPMLCLTGAVPQRQKHQHTHQSMDNVSLMKPVTVYSEEVASASAMPELVATAMQVATSGQRGGAYLSLPYDILLDESVGTPLQMTSPAQGPAPQAEIETVASIIASAQCPVVFAGAESTSDEAASAVRAFLKHHRMPVVNTWEAAGIVPRDLADCYLGRVGLFHNQPGDQLLSQADVIITIGFDQVEYDPVLWNSGSEATLIHINTHPADPDSSYKPAHQLIGAIGATMSSLDALLPELPAVDERPGVTSLREALHQSHCDRSGHDRMPAHPITVVDQIQVVADEDPNTTVICDVGSNYIWLGRVFRSYEPHHLLFSNGQQTLGVALPWAIATCLARPHTPVISMSGDGGFLFSAQELETAVRLGCNFTHLVWTEGTYDMVAFQQRMKYGRDSGVRFGEPDIVKYAESFGAQGLRLEQASGLADLIRQGLATPGPTLIDVPVDYSENDSLGAAMNKNWAIH